MSEWIIPIFPSAVSPVWPLPLRRLSAASAGENPRQRHHVGLQPAPPLLHQEGAVRRKHGEAAGQMSAVHHCLRQPPLAGQTHGGWAQGVSLSGRVFFLCSSVHLCVSPLQVLWWQKLLPELCKRTRAAVDNGILLAALKGAAPRGLSVFTGILLCRI